MLVNACGRWGEGGAGVRGAPLHGSFESKPPPWEGELALLCATAPYLEPREGLAAGPGKAPRTKTSSSLPLSSSMFPFSFHAVFSLSLPLPVDMGIVLVISWAPRGCSTCPFVLSQNFASLKTVLFLSCFCFLGLEIPSFSNRYSSKC